jgi:hypothetical protein
MAVRYRCAACGNLTRFDVVTTRRTRGFHHYSVGGDLDVEDETVLDEQVESVTCRWCGATGSTIEPMREDVVSGDGVPDAVVPDDVGADS